MRALLGLLVLGGLFAMAALYQDAFQARLREERARVGSPASLPEPGPAAPRGDWVNLVVGRPSGAEPFDRGELEPPSPSTPLPEDPQPRPEPRPVQPVFSPDRSHVVQSGEILGRICQRYYGTSRPKVLEAVARYNELANPGSIRQGQVLLIPDLELLLGDEP